MGLTTDQTIPDKATAEPMKWSVRSLLSTSATSKLIAGNFVNVFDVLLGFSIFIIGLCELFNRDVSWFFYLLTFLLLAGAFAERRFTVESETKKEK